MDYRELENGKYILTMKENGVIRDCISEEILYSYGKNYILTVKDNTYTIWDDYHKEEQVSYNFPMIEWFNVIKL